MNKSLAILILCLLGISYGFTASKDTSNVEFINVYFNSESDHKVALESNKSKDLQDMFVPLLNLIDSAKYSVDLVAYDLQNMRVGMAIANAARRGVRVRVITDNSNRNRNPRFNEPLWDTLRAAGIYSIDDAGTVYHPNGEIKSLTDNLRNAGAIMHHKFAVIDAFNDDPNDDYVWTGSMNLTYTGNWNTNVTFVIKDSGISNAYLHEFEQMWGSRNEKPNPFRARFHKNKEGFKNKIFYVNDIKVEVYFGPMDVYNKKQSISERITQLINEAKHDVRFLSFAISPDINISKAMIARSGRGEISLYGVIDPDFYARYRNEGQIWAQPEMSFGNRLVLPAKEVRKLHAKTIIIDAQHPYPEENTAITIAGSYNFSKAAELSNDENILMIHDNKIANLFLQDWQGVMNRAKGLSYHQYPDIDTGKWFNNYYFDKGKLMVELETGLFYPIDLLGVERPREWAGHKDSSFYYAETAFQYFKNLLGQEGTKLKITAGKEKPEHKFGRYMGYISAALPSGDTIEVNREMLISGNGTYSFWNRQQKDSILTFKLYEQFAKDAMVGMWAYPDSVGKKVLASEVAIMQNLFPLDINLATVDDLTYIKGIGKKTAESIIEYRNNRGKIQNLEELLKIQGIGDKTLENLKQFLIIEED